MAFSLRVHGSLEGPRMGFRQGPQTLEIICTILSMCTYLYFLPGERVHTHYILRHPHPEKIKDHRHKVKSASQHPSLLPKPHFAIKTKQKEQEICCHI